MTTHADVVVVGAGPGGCATALHLARRGHCVLMVDRATEAPRGGKVCGEGLMPHGVAALARLGVPTHDLGAPFEGIAYHAGNARAVGRFRGGRLGVGVRRSGLAERLAQHVARQPGIEVRRGVRVTGMACDSPAQVRLQTPQGLITARMVVGADGLHSTVRKLSGLQRATRGRRRYGARVHLQLAAGRAAPRTVNVHAADGVELYVTPVGPGQVNVALLLDERVSPRLRGDREGGLRALASRFAEGRALLDGAEPLSSVGVCGPLRQSVRGVVSDGVVLVGDAAGFVDAVTGEGMSLTLLSAELAAETVSAALAQGRTDRRALAGYTRRRTRLVRDLCTLTEVVVFGLRQGIWAERVVGALGRRPAAFEQFLAVQVGEAPITSVAPALAAITWDVARSLARQVVARRPTGELAPS